MRANKLLPRWAVFAAVLAVCLLALASPTPALGASFTVDATHDAVDANPGDGLCADVDGACTLRAAVMETNALAGADEITLPAGTYGLTIAGNGEGAGDFNVTDDLLIIGAGSDATIVDGGGLDRVLYVETATVEVSLITIRNGNAPDDHGGGIKNYGNLTLRNSTIAENQAGSSGGGISNSGVLLLAKSRVTRNEAPEGAGVWNSGTLELATTTVAENSGGGILNNFGTVTLTDSKVSANVYEGGGGGIRNVSGTINGDGLTVSDNHSASRGGGIFNNGVLSLTQSSISGNVASRRGGGIFNYADASAALSESTVTRNAAGQGAGIFHQSAYKMAIAQTTVSLNVARFSGGGIEHIAGILELTNSTISGNSAALSGGGIRVNSPVITLVNTTIANNDAAAGAGMYSSDLPQFKTLVNTIIALNAGPDCSGVGITSLGHNLDSDGSCGFTEPGDRPNTDPLLGPLADNGGPTQTHALLAGSPAIDAGDNAACPATDQRGAFRPQGVACDIGAYEVEPLCPPGCGDPVRPPSPSPTLSPSPSPTPTARRVTRRRAARHRRNPRPRVRRQPPQASY